jgi:outer membrane protein TolC
MRRLLFSLTAIMLALSLQVRAQHVLDEYIRVGLADNLVLKEKNISLEKSQLALKTARSLFLPTTYFEGQYTLANGGREISIPVGDLLNPVYQTLNQITGSSKFPTIPNVSEQLIPNNFYDLRIKTSVPVINPDIRYNRDIKQQETKLRENEIEIYKRDLVREIKQAYYTILLSNKAIGIYESALAVVKENLRTNQSMLSNGKGLPAYVSRAESEVKQVETQLLNASNEKQKAIAWFNSLLNRPMQENVLLDEIPLSAAASTALQQFVDNVNAREELKSLTIAKDINYKVLAMNKSFHTPKLNAFVDLAAQDFDFRVKSNSFFYIAGLQLNIPIFSGNRNLYKIQQSELDIKSIELTEKNTRNQLELAAFNSKSNARNNYNTYQSAEKQEESAVQYFKLIDRGYREGVNSFIEMLDARNQLTQSQLQKEVNRYRFLASLADYERQTSSYSF